MAQTVLYEVVAPCQQGATTPYNTVWALGPMLTMTHRRMLQQDGYEWHSKSDI